jgi:hypothetical protein
MIHSSHGKSGDSLLDYDFPLFIPRAIIQRWYNTWVDQAKDLLRDHLSTRQHHPYALAIVSGGGSKSSFFLSKIRHFFGSSTALRRHIP